MCAFVFMFCLFARSKQEHVLCYITIFCSSMIMFHCEIFKGNIKGKVPSESYYVMHLISEEMTKLMIFYDVHLLSCDG